MSQDSGNVFLPGPNDGCVRCSQGKIHPVPKGWRLLPPGDAALTRRVKLAGPHWIVQEKKGRKLFSRGVYAPTATIESIEQQLVIERQTESFAKKKIADAKRRQQQQESYVEDFLQAVIDFLNFDPRYQRLADALAKAVTEHATPVGSGTVARTKRIPIEKRAEAAVIAWMRHQTTAYDSMKIPRVKGMRREVRRMLAERSKQLLSAYRHGLSITVSCPLKTALMKTRPSTISTPSTP